MSNKIRAIEYSESLCFKCLKEKVDVRKHILPERGYGSDFDGTSSILQVCPECDDKKLEECFNEKPTEIEYWEEYKLEDYIHNFIRTLPVQGRELFLNSCAKGWTADTIDSQDWIDIELEIADDNTYKKWGFYSPSEIKAYEDRFPTCVNVYKKEYSDGSSGCYCPFGASGNGDGSCDINISDECYYCKNYKRKEDKNIKVIKESSLKREDLKKVEMLEWICNKCGQFNYNFTYQDSFVCERCHEWHEIVED